MACGEARGGMSARDALSAAEHAPRPPVEERRGRSPKMALYHYAAVDNVEYERGGARRVSLGHATRGRARERARRRAAGVARDPNRACVPCARGTVARGSRGGGSSARLRMRFVWRGESVRLCVGREGEPGCAAANAWRV